MRLCTDYIYHREYFNGRYIGGRLPGSPSNKPVGWIQISGNSTISFDLHGTLVYCPVTEMSWEYPCLFSVKYIAKTEFTSIRFGRAAMVRVIISSTYKISVLDLSWHSSDAWFVVYSTVCYYPRFHINYNPYSGMFILLLYCKYIKYLPILFMEEAGNTIITRRGSSPLKKFSVRQWKTIWLFIKPFKIAGILSRISPALGDMPSRHFDIRVQIELMNTQQKHFISNWHCRLHVSFVSDLTLCMRPSCPSTPSSSSPEWWMICNIQII